MSFYYELGVVLGSSIKGELEICFRIDFREVILFNKCDLGL